MPPAPENPDMPSIRVRSLCLGGSALGLVLATLVLGRAPAAEPDGTPTFPDVSYGPHRNQKLDFWQARTERPAPVVVFIHGGGFVGGDKAKNRNPRAIAECLDRGVHYASINYRFRTEVPIQEVLRDCARAIQFLRSRAADWKIDPARVAAYGGSAGAGSSLWLAFHDDLADPSSADPVLRQSSRLAAAGSQAGQFTYDILQWEELFGKDVLKYSSADTWPGFYGLRTIDDLHTPEGKRIRADVDVRGLISKDDPPVFLTTGIPDGEPATKGQYLHHPRHMQAIKKRCDELGVPAVLVLPGEQGARDDRSTILPFLLKHLGVEGPGR
jgi:acetyl esterase/lipase